MEAGAVIEDQKTGGTIGISMVGMNRPRESIDLYCNKYDGIPTSLFKENICELREAECEKCDHCTQTHIVVELVKVKDWIYFEELCKKALEYYDPGDCLLATVIGTRYKGDRLEGMKGSTANILMMGSGPRGTFDYIRREYTQTRIATDGVMYRQTITVSMNEDLLYDMGCEGGYTSSYARDTNQHGKVDTGLFTHLRCGNYLCDDCKYDELRNIMLCAHYDFGDRDDKQYPCGMELGRDHNVWGTQAQLERGRI